MGKVSAIREATTVSLPDIYDKWRMRIRFRDKILGSMPKNPGDMERFCASVAPNEVDAEELRKKLDGEVATDPLAEVGASAFKHDDTGLYIEDRQVKAAFKEAATLLGLTDRQDIASGCPGRQYFQHGFFVDPRRIYLGRTEPHGTERLFGNVMTARGPRSIVQNVDYCEGVEVEFTAKGLRRRPKGGKKKEDVSVLGTDTIKMMLSMMQDNGIGACRSQGFGKFDVIEFEAL